jgi:hypothetical protein
MKKITTDKKNREQHLVPDNIYIVYRLADFALGFFFSTIPNSILKTRHVACISHFFTRVEHKRSFLYVIISILNNKNKNTVLW